MEAKQVKGLMEAYASVYANISESHFKVGDEVVCKASGMEGEVVKVDPEEKGKYYTVKREDGKTMKYAPNELKLDKEEKESEKETEKEDVKEAKNGGISGSAETKFHKKLDSLVHHTFGKRKEEKSMKEEVDDEGGKHKEGKHPKGKEEPGEKVTEKEGKEKEKEMKESVDLFDYLLEYLVTEGYADTNKAALAIMANMSEEWKEGIIESIARGSAPNSPTGTIGGAAGRVAGTLLQRGAELIKKNMPQSGGGYSTRPGDGKPYKDGPLWDGPETSTKKPAPQRKPQGAPMRDEPLW